MSQGSKLGASAKSAVLLASILSAFVSVGLLSVLPNIAAHFVSTPGAGTLVRMTVTAVGVAMIVGAPMASGIARLFGFRRTLVLALLFYAIFGTVGYFLDNLYVLVASRFLLGFVTAVFVTLLVGMIGVEMDGEERNRWLGYVAMSASYGALVLGLLAAVIGRVDWRMPFLLHMMSVVILLLVIVGVPAHSKAIEKQPDAAPGAAGRFPFLIVVAGLVTGLLASAQAIYTPFHIVDIGETNPAMISILMLPCAITAGGVATVYGRWRRRFSINATFIAAFLIVGTGLASVGFANSSMLIAVAMLITGVGVGLVAPNLYAFAAQFGTDGERTRNMGFARSGFYLAPIVGQVVLEPIARLANAGMAVVALGILGVGSAVIVRAFARNPKPIAV